MKEENIEIIDLDFELLKLQAYEEGEAKRIVDYNTDEFQEKQFDLSFLSNYIEFNESIFEEIEDVLVDSEKKEWYRYTEALEQIREILHSRLYYLDALVHPKKEDQNNNII